MSQFTAEVQLFPVWKTNVRHVGFFFRLLLRPHHSNRRVISHQATEFRSNRATRGGVMTSYTISRWRQRRSISCIMWLYSFEVQNLSTDQISLTYLNPPLSYNYFRFEKKQTSAILEFFFSLQFSPDRSNLRAILYQVHKFRPNRAIHGGVMT